MLDRVGALGPQLHLIALHMKTGLALNHDIPATRFRAHGED